MPKVDFTEECGSSGGWILTGWDEEQEGEAWAQVALLLEPDGELCVDISLDSDSVAERIRFRLKEDARVMQWRRFSDNALEITLCRTALKSLVELWGLTRQGAGDYYLEMLDYTHGDGHALKTELRLHWEERRASNTS